MTDLRAIPSIEQLRQRPAVRALEARYGHASVVDALRAEAAAVRQRMRDGDLSAFDEDAAAIGDALERDAAARLAATLRPSLTPVINATGVIVHTNLGRAPLAAGARSRVEAVAGGYANLEYDLESGTRGRRDVHAEALLCRLTGAEAGLVVNNCAAATLLALAALARGRDVVVSRGELVEIGGGFRVPDVLAQSGARLREVGTTNRTRVADYAAAIGDRTAALLRVHRSNFRIEGFTERPALAELAALARRFDLPLIEDLGSGLALPAPVAIPALAGEPTVQESLQAGADVVCFSGDKLLGGPQAGLIVGRRLLVATIRQHPLMRALRVDKLTYAALEATLQEFLAGRAAETIPVLRMAAAPPASIATRAARLAERLRPNGWTTTLVEGHSTIGGGSAPGSTLPTTLVALSLPGLSADTVLSRLRGLDPPVIGRIENDQMVLDLRTVPEDEDERLAALLAAEPAAREERGARRQESS